ncbi:MAG: energy-coupling factor transporter transmembrane component T [Candidatus Saccharicenans sp.]|nr:energy-coupling factor transporter transmembrane component T [Candidatus Saccharicenans sp.]
MLFWLTSPEEPGDVPEYAARIACRMLLILLANLIFIASQNISFMLITLNELRIFRPAAQLILTAYRYFHIFTSEATNAFRARVLRTTTELPLTNFRVTGWVIEKILYRAIERSQRIYAALTLRGYDGNLYLFRKLEVSIFDFLFLAGWCSLILITVFL